MGPILHMARKEFIQAFRDPRMFAVIFIAPILQLFLFGYAVTTDVNNLRVAVLDRDRSPASREILRGVIHSGYFTFLGSVEGREGIEDALVRDGADLVLAFPERFARRLDRGQAAPLQALLDGTDSNSAGVAVGYLQKILFTFGRNVLADRMERMAGAAGSAVRIGAGSGPEVRYLYNPELKSSWYMVPGVLAMILLVITMLLTSLAITREREIGTMEQLVVTPIRPWQLLAGKMIPFALIGLVDVTLILAVAAGHFRLPMVGSVGLLYLAATVFLFTTLGMGLLISTLSHTQQQAIFLALMVMLPSVLLSGLMFPIANMPEPVQWLTYANPLRYFLVIVRGVILKGNGLDVLGPQLFMLLALGAVVFSLAVARFHKTID